MFDRLDAVKDWRDDQNETFSHVDRRIITTVVIIRSVSEAVNEDAQTKAIASWKSERNNWGLMQLFTDEKTYIERTYDS
jgi:hypothetical protein